MRSQARAITLIEVVASLVLIATTATALLTAHARSLAQLSATRDRATAHHLAGELIAKWRIEPPGLAAQSEGEFEASPGWRWSRSDVPYASQSDLKLRQVTLAIHHTEHRGTEATLLTFTWLERIDENPPAD